MSPPKYDDLGKSARDVMGKGYHFNVLKLELKTKTANGVEFTSGGQSNLDNGKVNGSLETKYKFKEHGVTFTEKWSTDNQLSTTIDIQDQLVKGLKLTFDSSFSPATGNKSGKLKTEFRHEQFTANADVDLNLGGPVVNGSAVVGHNGWFAGYSMAFDSNKSTLTKNNFGLGYSAGDFVLHSSVNSCAAGPGPVFGGSVFQKVSPQLETGVTLGWSAANNSTNLGVGCKYALDRDTSVRAKINNNTQLGLGYQQRLRPGVTLTLSTLIDTRNFNQGGHKVGAALEMEC